jgi:dTDP-4-dehydrorhamnose reductase
MRVLLTGSTGQVGHELAACLAGLGDVVALERGDLDLARPDSIAGPVAAVAPDIVINAAAYTAVDRAERELDLARLVNAIAPGLLARAARRCGALFVHYSTDYVFDGRSDRPYRPGDAPAPLNAYGRSKLAGEKAVREEGGCFLILRTSWIYSARRPNFLCSVLERARQGLPLRVVDDQIGSPTPARLVSEMTACAIERRLTRRDGQWSLGGREGLFHLACAGQTSRFAFAQAILELSGLTVDINAISSEEYPAAALRPTYSALDSTDFEAAFDLGLPAWDSALSGFLRTDGAQSCTSKALG